MKNSKVYVYGLCNVFYDSYYIQGLKEVFSTVEFNVSKFPEFRQGTFACIVSEKGKETNIVVDSRDSNEIDILSLDWCDKYGKVNYNLDEIPLEKRDKIIAIGPSFGIKIWSLPETIYFALSHFYKFRKNIKNKREFIANYWRQYKRCKLNEYLPKNSDRREVFFISSIWKNEKKTNDFRASFIIACKKNESVSFEGGFAPRNDGDNLGYNNLLYPKPVSLKEYLAKIKKSIFVFNTPAVLSCHGWKLAEFLAMGKAIISTPHCNTMPELLLDNIHLLYASNSTEIEEKIKILVENSSLKKSLEFNSREYFKQNLVPKVAINRLL